MRRGVMVCLLGAALLVLGAGVVVAGENVQGAIEHAPGYWTEERIKEALQNPADIPREGAPRLFIEEETPPDPPILVPPQMPEGGSPMEPVSESLPQTSLACPASAYSWWFDTNNTAYPQCTVGRLLFTGSNGKPMACSGALVYKNIVLTAGHCVTSNQVWHANIRFVPGYKQGSRPYGTIYAKTAWVKSSWFYHENFGRDVAFVKLWSDVGNRTGWLGQLYNATRADLSWYQNGYPSEPPFSGYLLAVNLASYGGSFSTLPPAMAIGSALTKGSSGGPWILFRDKGPYANSVTSFHLISCPRTKGGPYFDSDIHSMFVGIRDAK